MLLELPNFHAYKLWATWLSAFIVCNALNPHNTQAFFSFLFRLKPWPNAFHVIDLSD